MILPKGTHAVFSRETQMDFSNNLTFEASRQLNLCNENTTNTLSTECKHKIATIVGSLINMFV